MSDKNARQLLLEARFRQLAKDRRENNEMPEELRLEVFRTLDRIEATGASPDRAAGNAGEATAAFLDSLERATGEDSSEQ